MSTQIDRTESLARDAGATDAGFGLNPLVGFGADDLIGAFGQISRHALQHPWNTLDTQAEPRLGHLMTAKGIEAARAISRQRGVLEGADLGRIFAWMRPKDLIWNYWVNNYLLGNDPPAFDLLYWNADTTRLPARLHSDFLDLLLHNPLSHPASLTVAGTPIDLSQTTCDSFIIGGSTDHITPWQACYATTQMLGGSVEFVLSSNGHIQSVINPPGNTGAMYFLNPQLPAGPEAWLLDAQQHSGSWWDHWRDWLVARSGQRRPAPITLGDACCRPRADAPGAYVFSF
jgi:polyhydroxyalkanoate synthase